MLLADRNVINHAPYKQRNRGATQSKDVVGAWFVTFLSFKVTARMYFLVISKAKKVMRKLLTVLTLLFMVSFNLFAQSYGELWKQVDVARGKDLPKTQLAVLKKIVSKAQKEKSYGNLLAAELLSSSLQTQISPDSVDTEKARLKELCDKTEKTDKILHAVYCCALGKLFDSDDAEDNSSTTYFDKAMANPALLADAQYSKYAPLIKGGKNDAIFKNDLLHVIAFESEQYDKADKYYSSVGNREAAC